MKIWKGRKEKVEDSETVDAVTHTHTHKYVLDDKNVGAAKARKNIKKENLFSSFYTFTSAAWKICKANFTGVSAHEKEKNIRTHLYIVPLIVVLMLICVITIILFVRNGVGRPTETAELNKDISQEEEQISAAVDIAATDIGTNVKATFTASTGEICIYKSINTGDNVTINKTNWYNFLKKIVDADGNLDAVKTITFGYKNYNLSIYAPADSSYLFSPIISSASYPFSKLTNINRLDLLNTSKVTKMSAMFYKCESLTLSQLPFEFDKVTSTARMFKECSSLQNIRLQGAYVEDQDEMFAGCLSLTDVVLEEWRGKESVRHVLRMFEPENR